MVSGDRVLREIKSKIREVEGTVGRLEGDLNQYEAEIDRLARGRDDLYDDLVTLYASRLDEETLDQVPSAVVGEVRAICKEKQRRRKQLDGLMQESQQESLELEDQLEKATFELDQKTQGIEKLEQQAVGKLEEDKTYVELDKKAKQANEMLDANRARVEQVQREAGAKLPEYEFNRMFMYLVNKGYETNSGETGLIARLDRGVARIVHFKENKRCYDFLRSMPELMAAEVDKRQEELDEIVRQMEAIEGEVSDDIGLSTATQEGIVLGEKRSSIMEKLEQGERNYERYASERAEIDSKKGKYHSKVKQTLKDYFQGQTMRKLKRMSRETPDPTDDRIVERIKGLDLEIYTLRGEARRVKKDRDAVADKLSGLRSVRRSFVSHDYDSNRSEFSSGFDVDCLLTAYLSGEYSARTIKSKIDSAQHFRPRPTYRSSSSYNSTWSSSGGSGSYSSGGGFGGGSFSSGGGFGGGGFSSGSGF